MPSRRRTAIGLAVLVGVCGVAAAFEKPELYIANYGSDQILRADLSGELHIVFDSSDGLDGPFGANALSPTPLDLLIVSNFNSRTVLRMPSGEVLLGPEDGLDTPEAVALYDDGTLYLADRGTHQILRRSAGGAVDVFDWLVDAPMSIAIGGGTLFVATRAGEILAYPKFDIESRHWLGNFGPGGNVAMIASDDGHELLYLDDGRLYRIDTHTLDEQQIGERMDFADEGLALLRAADSSDVFAFAADFSRANIWRVNVRTGETGVFLTREDGLAGPSAMLVLPPQVNCGVVFPCDANCDGRVNFNDIDAFVLAMIDLEEYRAGYPRCDPYCQTDVNNDGAINFNDIDGFVSCLVYE